MTVCAKGNRKFRKLLQHGVKNKRYNLRVVNVDGGYKLAAERGNCIIPFSKLFKKQGEAKTYAFVKFNQTAKAVIVKKVA